MKAWICREIAGPEKLTLEDVPVTDPGPGQVLVHVGCASLNFPDVLMLEDLYQAKRERPFIPGSDLAGRVVALGEGVTDLKVGDRVCGMSAKGGLAELVPVSRRTISVIPDFLPMDVASCMKTAYGTSLHALRDRAHLAKGETVLVLGAAGGVGLSAVELARALGAGRIVGAVSSEDKASIVREAGADEVIVYPRAPFDRDTSRALAREFKAAAPDGFDVIYDAVGGDYAEPALRSAAWEGRYLVIGFTAGIPRLPTNLALLKGASIVGVYWGDWAMRNPAAWDEETQMLFDLYGQGKLRPLILPPVPFEQGAEALARMRDRKAVGKLVVTVCEDVT